LQSAIVAIKCYWPDWSKSYKLDILLVLVSPNHRFLTELEMGAILGRIKEVRRELLLSAANRWSERAADR